MDDPAAMPDYLATRAEVVWNDNGGSDKVYGVMEILCFKFPPGLSPPIHNTVPCYLCVAFYGRREAINLKFNTILGDIAGNSNTPVGQRLGMDFGRSENLAKMALEVRQDRAPYFWSGATPEWADGGAYGRGLEAIVAKTNGGYSKNPQLHDSLRDATRCWLEDFRQIRSEQTGSSPDNFQPTPANVIAALFDGTPLSPEDAYQFALDDWVRQNGGEPPTSFAKGPPKKKLAPRKFNRRRNIRL